MLYFAYFLFRSMESIVKRCSTMMMMMMMICMCETVRSIYKQYQALSLALNRVCTLQIVRNSIGCMFYV